MTEPDPLPADLRAMIAREARGLFHDARLSRGGIRLTDAEAFGERIARLAWEARGRAEWQPIESAPKDGSRFDVWAKAWLPAFDRFEGCRFATCYWRDGDSMGAWKAGIVGVSRDWRPTHWMPLPPSPTSDEPAQEPSR